MIRLTVRTNIVKKRLADKAKAIRAAAVHGIGQACVALLDDAMNEEPMVPLDEGTLRGSGSTYVEPKGFAKISGVVGFNTPYAAYQHEGIRDDGSRPVENYSHEGTGAKFLETKMMVNKDKYIAIARDAIAREIASL